MKKPLFYSEGETALFWFAALRFAEDENISDRVYWYLADEPFAAGDGVLAPVGAHNRLQYARVERTLRAEKEDAPYDMRLIKRVEARYGDRKRIFGETVFWELGGVRYDFKRFTRFRKVLFTDCETLSEEVQKSLAAYGVSKMFYAGEDIFTALLNESCVALYGEKTGEIVREMLAAVRGQECALSPETVKGLQRKLQ